MVLCEACVHKIEIAGNYHIGCNNPKAKVNKKQWPGCGLFPLIFDANIIVDCSGFSSDEQDKLPRTDSLVLELFRLWMG